MSKLLVAEDLCKHFQMGPSRLEVLRGCALAVSAGEFVAIMGKSGSGKSTLLHILGALDVPQQGQVIFRDRAIFASGRRSDAPSLTDALRPSERRRIEMRRRHFGFVFQSYYLLPELNVLENVLLPRMIGATVWQWFGARAEARSDALAVLERVGLAERLKHRPNELSGGERQRVALARALVHRPAVLLADEPTGNLDSEAGESIMRLIKQLHADGQTIVMVTHDPAVANHSDRILRLEDGQLRRV